MGHGFCYPFRDHGPIFSRITFPEALGSTFRGLMRLRGVACRAPDGYAEAFTCRKILL